MEAPKNEQGKLFTAPEIKLHFLDYWRIIRIRKTVIIAVFLLVALTTTLVTFILPQSYVSTARIRVDKDVQDVRGLNEGQVFGGYDPYFLQTEFEVIQSKTVLYKVIENLDLNREWAKKLKETGDLKTEVAYYILKGQLDVRQARNTSLIEIRVFSEDPKEAAVIANEIAKVYGETRRASRAQMTTGGLKALQKKWDEQDEIFKKKQTDLADLKSKLRISDADTPASGHFTTLEPQVLRTAQENLIASKLQYQQYKTLYEQVTNMTRAERKQAIVRAYPDEQLSRLLEQEHAAEQKLAEVTVSLGKDNPDFQKIVEVYDTITNQVSAGMEGMIRGLAAKVAVQKAIMDTLTSELKDAEDRDIEKSNERRPYFLLKRDLEGMEMMRAALERNIKAQEIDLDIPKTSVVEVVDMAEPGMRPVRPNKPLNISLGILVGLVLGVGLAFFIEYLDTSVKTIDDVERALQAPVLGVIPQNVGSLLEEGPDSPHAEAYRVLRTNVLFTRKDPTLNSMTIVSAGAGEGKSTTLFNLATIFAQNGQRVLIVDSDLRRPSIHKLLHLTNSIGLTNYLLKQNTLEEVIQTTSLPTLDFMPSGKLPSSSMGILSSVQMKELIRDVKRRYDFVFFDSPPIMGVSDASVLASEVDLVMQVIQYRRYPQPMTIRAKQMIEKVGGNLLGIVLNNINMSQDENYYYYSGYYYDYYAKSEEATDVVSKKGEKGDGVEIKSKY